jgi:hypothetical protein
VNEKDVRRWLVSDDKAVRISGKGDRGKGDMTSKKKDKI